jgi:phosphatidylglycerol:prolipoprotein diacylglycerol transferase
LQFPSHSPASEWQFRQKLLPTPLDESLAVHPTQLYESFAALAIAAFTILYVQGRKRYDGQVFVVFCLTYAVSRFVIELWRSDDRGGVLGLSTSQWIGLVMALVGLGIHYGRTWRRSRRAPLPGGTALASPVL